MTLLAMTSPLMAIKYMVEDGRGLDKRQNSSYYIGK
jgi:hypothetical protein